MLLYFSIAALRLATHKSVAMGIIGTDALTVSVSVILVALGGIYGIGFLEI